MALEEFDDDPELSIQQSNTSTDKNDDSPNSSLYGCTETEREKKNGNHPHAHFQDSEHHEGDDAMPLIAPPIQRQKWGDSHVLPHVNWGDLFFDLFYVAAAYNLAAMLKYNLKFECVLYFAACFQPLFHAFWMDKLLYEARFITYDIFHRILEVIKLCLLATAVLHIRPDMNHAKNANMFLFCGSCFIGLSLGALHYIEIAFIWVNGHQKQSSAAAITQLILYIPFFLIYGGATVYSGILHFRNRTAGGYGDDQGDTNYIPAILMASTWLIVPLNNYLILVKVRGRGDYKLRSVPMNIQFNIHRIGEWVMLMLGESILSLLIVEYIQGSLVYNVTFYSGILSVIFLQFLHYKNQPHDPNEHAMLKSRERGNAYLFLLSIYSAALIVVGACYKMFLTEYVKEASYEAKKDSYDAKYSERSLLSASCYEEMRFLGGEETSVADSYSKEDRQQRIAYLFVSGLALAFLSLDLQILSHKGIKESLNKLKSKDGKIRIDLIMLGIFPRVLTVLATFLASVFLTEPMHLALFGLGIIVTSIVLRFIAGYFITSRAKTASPAEKHVRLADSAYQLPTMAEPAFAQSIIRESILQTDADYWSEHLEDA